MMDYDVNPKLEPPDSPLSQDRFSPEFDLSSPESTIWGTYCNSTNNNNNNDNKDIITTTTTTNNASSTMMVNNNHTNDSTASVFENDCDDYVKEGIRRLCLVCGDVASGLHYGVASCEACKAFFKRTIQGGIEYTCPATGSCEITRSRRKACQACRFQKCLHMGMLREGVRPDRVRGGRQKYRRLNDSPSVVIRTSKPQSQRKQPSSDSHIRPKTENVKVCKSIGSKLLIILKAIEPEKVFAMPDTSTQDDDFKFKVTISDLTDRELVAIIGWVKQVPDFSNLRLADQMNLLRSTWLDIVCLNVAYRSLPYDGDIVFADDLKLSEGDACVYGVPGELDRVVRRLIRKLAEVKVNYEEYLLIKALLLFNPDAGLEDMKSVQQQRDTVLDGLLDYEGCHKDSNLPQRVSDLLLILPLVIHTRFVMRDFWLTIASDSNIVLHKLLREMLDHAVV